MRWPWQAKSQRETITNVPVQVPVFRSYPGNRQLQPVFGMAESDPDAALFINVNNPRMSTRGIVPDPKPAFWNMRQDTIGDWLWFGGADLAPHAHRDIVVKQGYVPIPQENYMVLGESYPSSGYVFIDPATGMPTSQ